VDAPEPVEFRGRVVAADTGAPIPGARVTVHEDEHAVWVGTPGATDATGAFSFRAPAQFVVGIRVHAAGFAPEVVRPDDAREQMIVRLDPAGSVTGTVRGADHRASPGAQVAARPDIESYNRRGDEPDPEATTADGDGRFTLDGLRFGWTYRLVATTPERDASGEADGVCVTAASPTTRADVVVQAHATLRVTVRDDGAAPVTGAAVLFARGRTIVRHVLTDAAGKAEWSGAEPGRWTVVVLGDGAQPWFGEVSLAPGEERDVDVELLPEWTVAGVLVDAAGGAVDASDTVLQYDRVPGLEGVEHFVRTPAAADGSFRIRGYGHGLRGIDVRRSGADVAHIDLEGPTDDLRVEIARFVRVRFTFTPRQDLWIGWDAFDADGEEIGSDYEELPGGREVTLCVPPCARLRIRPDGRLPVTREISAAAGGEVDLGAIAFEAGATLAALVEDPDHRPVARARVWIWTLETDLVESAWTDAAGRIEVAGVPLADLLVEVETPGFLPDEHPVDTREPGPKTIRLRRGGLVRASAADSTGRGVADVSLALLDEGGADEASAEPGRPLVARVAPGRRRLVARRGEDEVGAAAVEVVEGGVHDVVVTLQR
jgi:hypothetical protein